MHIHKLEHTVFGDLLLDQSVIITVAEYWYIDSAYYFCNFVYFSKIAN